MKPSLFPKLEDARQNRLRPCIMQNEQYRRLKDAITLLMHDDEQFQAFFAHTVILYYIRYGIMVNR